ncbi:MAG TPA: family 43 glycosylhydrolase [Candidatus Brocadiia bacterium]|nr:family 43 glycosylhydrolase [Candidatus Brocadiia bacterium]
MFFDLLRRMVHGSVFGEACIGVISCAMLMAGCVTGTISGKRDVNEQSIEIRPVLKTYCNPLPVLLADPFVLKHGDTYYLYATSLDNGFLVWTSMDLVNWRVMGPAIKADGTTWGQGNYWAPEAIERNGEFLLHYSALHEKGGQRRICVARSDSPLGPFREVSAPMFERERSCIDANVFIDLDGKAYLYFVMEFPNRIMVAPLSDDLISIICEPKLCLFPAMLWEMTINEGPTVIRRGDVYYMIYSGHGANGPNYAVGYATAPSPTGPWTKYGGNPIMKKTDRVSGPGHGCVIASPDGKELFYVYHSLQQRTGWPRQLCLDRLRFIPDGKGGERIVIDGPTHTPQPLPSGAPVFSLAADDEFEGKALDRNRWIVFNERDDRWRLQDGRLVITAMEGDLHEKRADLANLFLQHAPERDFEITTKARFLPEKNYEQAFLCVYQDHNYYLRFSRLYADRAAFEIGLETRGEYIGKTFPAPDGGETWLRVKKTGNVYTCMASADGERWEVVGSPVTADFEGLKIGIGASTPGSGREIEAGFDFFHIR